MRKYLLSILIISVTLSITGCGLQKPLKKEKHLEQQVIYRMIQYDVGKPIPKFPDEMLVQFDEIVEKYGDTYLSDWVAVNNTSMIIECLLGNWTPVCIQQEDSYYKYDMELVGPMSAKISRNGISYVIGDTVVNTVSCRLSDGAVVTEDNFQLKLTDYGCLAYEGEYYTVILSKEK